MRDESIPPFEFATAARVVFGAGRLAEVGAIARSFGRRALIVTGSHPERAQGLQARLKDAGVTSETYPVQGEPTTRAVATGLARARLKGPDLIIGFGGGSAIDAAKAIAGLLTNDRDLFDFLEVIGRGEAMSRPAAPWIAIPTTAGAGAEVTRNAVLTSREHHVKASLRSPYLLPKVALVDPELTLDLPPDVTTATGLDALTQLIESFVSIRANPLVDALCLEGVRRVARSLRRAVADGRNLPARTDMALAALFGGIALTNAGLGVVHGLAAPLGGHFPAAHGTLCAALLPHAMALNLQALRQRVPDSPSLERFATLAQALTGRPDSAPEHGVEWIRELVGELAAPTLRALGVGKDSFPEIADKSAAASSMKSNPVSLSAGELIALLESAW
ncbi:MAG: iron-containing alcohol dehydrogenase [Limisphaerales bacterium]